MTIEITDIGKRLDVYTSEKMSVTRSAAQKLIEDGFVTVNDKKPAKNYRLRENDEFDCELPEPVPADAIPQDISIDIIYEDSDLLVVNKPRGMVVHPAPGSPDHTLVNALLWHVKDLSGINGVVRPGIVHRIDKNTSGLLIVAKNDTAHLALAEQIKVHSFEREYEAILVGKLKTDTGTVDAPIGRSPRDRKKMAITENGRPARTHYRAIEYFRGFTHAALKLETGRTHQIRVHMSSIGHPVFGDETYGGGHTKAEQKMSLGGQCLHARSIGFTHPTTGEFLRFTSPLPEYFQNTLDLLHREYNE